MEEEEIALLKNLDKNVKVLLNNVESSIMKQDIKISQDNFNKNKVFSSFNDSMKGNIFWCNQSIVGLLQKFNDLILVDTLTDSYATYIGLLTQGEPIIAIDYQKLCELGIFKLICKTIFKREIDFQVGDRVTKLKIKPKRDTTYIVYSCLNCLATDVQVINDTFDYIIKENI